MKAGRRGHRDVREIRPPAGKDVAIAIRCRHVFFPALPTTATLSGDAKPDNMRAVRAIGMEREKVSSSGSYASLPIDDYRALLHQGRFGDALAKMLAALPAHPDHPRLNKLIGVAYLLSGKPAESVPYFEKCAALEEANAEARFDLSVAYEAAGELSWAAKALRAAIRIDGDYADAHNNLGLVLAKQDLLDQAVEHLRHAVASNPDSALFHGNLGAILSRQEAMDEAAGHFETAIRLDPAFA
jgi:tetratricopeptide (TPR) repeat protein